MVGAVVGAEQVVACPVVRVDNVLSVAREPLRSRQHRRRQWQGGVEVPVRDQLPGGGYILIEHLARLVRCANDQACEHVHSRLAYTPKVFQTVLVPFGHRIRRIHVLVPRARIKWHVERDALARRTVVVRDDCLDDLIREALELDAAVVGPRESATLHFFEQRQKELPRPEEYGIVLENELLNATRHKVVELRPDSIPGRLRHRLFLATSEAECTVAVAATTRHPVDRLEARRVVVRGRRGVAGIREQVAIHDRILLHLLESAFDDFTRQVSGHHCFDGRDSIACRDVIDPRIVADERLRIGGDVLTAHNYTNVRQFPFNPTAEGGSSQVVGGRGERNADGFDAEDTQVLDRLFFWDADASNDPLHGAVPLEGGPLLQEIVGRQSAEIRHLLRLDVFPGAIDRPFVNATNVVGLQLADAERTALPATVPNGLVEVMHFVAPLFEKRGHQCGADLDTAARRFVNGINLTLRGNECDVHDELRGNSSSAFGGMPFITSTHHDTKIYDSRQ